MLKKYWFIFISVLIIFSGTVKSNNSREFYKADSIFVLANQEFNRYNYSSASKNALKAAQLYHLENNRIKKTESYILLAEILYLTDQFEELEELLPKIETDISHLNLENKRIEVKYLYIKFTYYRYTGNTKECTVLYENIKKLIDHATLEPEFIARLYRQMGNYFLFTTSQYYLAEQMYDTALYYLKNYVENEFEEFKCHWCLGQTLTRQKKYYHANEHLVKCEAMYDNNKSLFKIHISYVYSFRMEVYGSLGNEKMLRVYFNKLQESFNIYKDFIKAPLEKEKFYLNYVLAYINLSDYYYKSNRIQMALDILKRAEKEIGEHEDLLVYVYDRQARLYLLLNDYEKAEISAKIMLKLYEKSSDNSIYFSDIYFLLANIEEKKNNLERQKIYLKNGLATKELNKITKVKLLTDLGINYYKLRNIKSSFEEINKSILLNIGMLDIDSIFLNYIPDNVYENEFLFKSLFIKGEILNEMGKNSIYERDHFIDLADKHMKYSIDLYEKYLIYLESEYDINNILDEKRQKIKRYIYFLIDSYEFTKDFDFIKKAFQYIEKSKATTLNLSFEENKAKIRGNIPKYLVDQENEINKKISSIVTALNYENEIASIDEYSIQELSDSLSKLKNQKKHLIDYYEENYQDYYNLKYNTSTFTLEEVKVNLKPDQALAEYYLIDNFLFIYFISQKYTGFYRQNVNKEFINTIMSVRNHIEDNNIDISDPEPYDNFITNSNNLYNILIAPFKNEIKGKTLIIVPDDILALLPFDILLKDTLNSNNMKYDYSSLSFLIKYNALSYAYSASVLFKNKLKNQMVNNVIAFAPVKYPDKSISENLKNISGSEKEVMTIAQIFPTKKFLETRATESNFKNIKDEKSIIHLAMHTLINEEKSMYSRMVFYPEKSEKEDGLLYTYEIYNMNFKSPLVFLSSCESGYGKLQNGEGYKSLAWAFKFSGVQSIVLTLWKVSDNASVKIVNNFYRVLKKGISKERSLQISKLKYLNTCDPLKTHPFYWSSFNLTGNTDSLQVRHSLKYKYIIFIFTYIVILIIFLIRVKNKKQQV